MTKGRERCRDEKSRGDVKDRGRKKREREG